MWKNIAGRVQSGIDSIIAEEQARQRASQTTPQRGGGSSGAAGRASRTATPGSAARGGQSGSGTGSKSAGSGDAATPSITGKGPDPAEFEADFVIGDEESRSATPASGPSRTGTPTPRSQPKVTESVTSAPKVADNDGEEANGAGQAKTTSAGETAAASTDVELPTDVKAKLRKLERLESRYNDLLKSYRIAHSRVSAIEIFEAALRENTPLTSINDTKAFVEYLNQSNLKTDMVLEELKKVSSDRNDAQKKLEAAEKDAREAWDEVATLKKPAKSGSEDQSSDATADGESKAEENSTSTPTKDERSQTDGALSPPLGGMLKTAGRSLFSPKRTPDTKATEETEESEELFSYDNEAPRLEAELKENQQHVETLQKEVKTLRNDLTVARESTQSMVQTLEEATREANNLRDQNEELRTSTEAELSDLRTELEAADTRVRRLQIEAEQLAASQGSAEQEELQTKAKSQLAAYEELQTRYANVEKDNVELKSKLETLEKNSQASSEKSTKRSETLERLMNELREQVKAREKELEEVKSQLKETGDLLKSKQEEIDALAQRLQKSDDSTSLTKSDNKEAANEKAPAEGAAKKKNNKKKKGKGGQPAAAEAAPATKVVPAPASTGSADQTGSKDEIAALQEQIKEKDAAIDRLNAKMKNNEDLQEEIEGLRDELINVGQDHVIDKETIKTLQTEKKALQDQLADAEKELVELRTASASTNEGNKQVHSELTKQFEELKVKSSSLQTDLSVAQQLASSRFKDLTDLRSVLQKAQPELNSLRKDNAELKTARDELKARVSELERIETRHNTVRSELATVRRVVGERDGEINDLNRKLAAETSSKAKEEEARLKAVKDLESAESERRQAQQSLERSTKDLAKSREELSTARAKISDLESTLSRLEREAQSLKEEIELKTAQHASAESLMTSMRDQASEMATQGKESRGRVESLEEEVAEAHRLLGERNREAETMRRLLNDIEGRTEGRIRELKDRLDTAIEERDRTEEEASTTGRRRAREVEEMRSKLRDAERNLKRAEEDRDELEVASRDWKRRREELESRADSTGKESEEVRKAMAALRDALDESEKQARDMERQRSDVRRSLEETQQRLDRAQKSNKIMAEELRSLQNKLKAAPPTSTNQSPRRSLESSASRSRVDSPAPAGSNGQGPASSEAYLKNVLLQFLETKEQKHRVQLIPVLSMLLHFDKQDEQKWMAAIATK